MADHFMGVKTVGLTLFKNFEEKWVNLVVWKVRKEGNLGRNWVGFDGLERIGEGENGMKKRCWKGVEKGW